MISQEFLCLCEKSKTWIEEGRETPPCPHCGRQYVDEYDAKSLQLIGREINPKGTRK